MLVIIRYNRSSAIRCFILITILSILLGFIRSKYILYDIWDVIEYWILCMTVNTSLLISNLSALNDVVNLARSEVIFSIFRRLFLLESLEYMNVLDIITICISNVIINTISILYIIMTKSITEDTNEESNHIENYTGDYIEIPYKTMIVCYILFIVRILL